MPIKRLSVAFMLSAFSVAGHAAEDVNISNWNGYIADDTLVSFTQATGIKATYDIHDSNEVLESKLMTGNTGYDVVSPSNHFLSRLIKAGAIQKLDRSQLPNWKNLNPVLMKKLEANDPGNQYGFPYMWGTAGIGYNVEKIKAIFGNTDVTRSWKMFFDEDTIKKLGTCGVAIIDNPTQILPITLNYLGLPHHSHEPGDYKKAEQALLKIRPYVQYFHASKYISDLANGNICAVIGFNGDVVQAATSAKEAKNGIEIAYSIPEEGTTLWLDMVVMPKAAPHEKNAYAYMNYLLDPKVIANISNSIHYANPNSAADEFLTPAVKQDPAIYPPSSVMDKLFIVEDLPPAIARLATRLWTKLKTNT
ncbi:polyamine ABC transporter substrate-binding protein [Pseudomonas haemolytica]|uniref:Polyamine ABC transporter substrate-binding protein n=1 Tax=Pseudomonas haemolytica TaxID=2600065 RepID=A0A5P1DIR6_9PSED|nr:polyamine ABC transporter substrate-binding protein [Pseudomonas haemolytica]MBJ2249274.1 polyamine ABC transporter substrate-binding protein [Pseudomonas haemolytica]MBJ2276549.1 polyamine ABC transporter substrate-binding protein [Pseudomonas haemolytica]MBK3448764.1 polyamine ABC transporter substrate-binding protein [Pseudomonas haemolytica]MBK3459983.1 polyamine ABC transporter substrate-binding protein [Pseudomonas haemolytica]MRJ20855.1 polyamine ABC transporter substrate-binding pro